MVAEICENSGVLQTIYVVKTVVQILTILTPIVVIITLTTTLFKCVLSSDNTDEKIKGSIKNKLIASFMIFFAPIIITTIIDLVNPTNKYASCFKNANAEYIAGRKAAEKIEFEKEQQKKKQEQEIAEQKRKEQEAKKETETPQETPKKYAKSLTYYNQCVGTWSSANVCGGGKTMCKTGCGHTSFSIMARTFGNRAYTPSDIRNLVCSGRYNYSGGAWTCELFTNSKLLNDVGLEASTIIPCSYGNNNKTYNPTYGNQILKAVQEGKGVTLYIPGHYVAVGPHPSCNTNQVYLYDVGRSRYNGCYTPEQLWNITWNYQNRCNTGAGCGWKGAIAYNGK